MRYYRAEYLLPLVLATVSILQLTRSADHGGRYTVVLTSWESVQENFSVSLVTETELSVQTMEHIKLRHVHFLSCTLTKIENSSHTEVTINNEMVPLAKILTDKRMVDLTGSSSIKRGQLNKISLETVTTYTLSSPAYGPCFYKTYPLFKTQINRFFHLYVFDTPVLHRGNDSRTIVCSLQNGMEEYTDFFVSFIREYVDRHNKTRNVTVGRCSSTDRHPLEHHGMSIYYDRINKSCVMELPDMIDAQLDTGTYYCDVRARNGESNELIMHGKRMVIIDPEPNPPTGPVPNPPTGPVPNPPTGSPVAAFIAPPVVVFVGIALIIIMIVVIAVLRNKHQQQDPERQQLVDENNRFQQQQNGGSNVQASLSAQGRSAASSQARLVAERVELPVDPIGGTPSTIHGTPSTIHGTPGSHQYVPFDEQGRISNERSSSAADECTNPLAPVNPQPISLDSAPSSTNSRRSSASGDNAINNPEEEPVAHQPGSMDSAPSQLSSQP